MSVRPKNAPVISLLANKNGWNSIKKKRVEIILITNVPTSANIVAFV